MFAAFEAAYAEARGSLYGLRAEAAEAAEAAGKGKKGGGGGGKGKGGKGDKADKDAPPEPVVREFPERWGGGVREVMELLAELEGVHTAARAAAAEAAEAVAGGSKVGAPLLFWFGLDCLLWL